MQTDSKGKKVRKVDRGKRGEETATEIASEEKGRCFEKTCDTVYEWEKERESLIFISQVPSLVTLVKLDFNYH